MTKKKLLKYLTENAEAMAKQAEGMRAFSNSHHGKALQQFANSPNAFWLANELSQYAEDEPEPEKIQEWELRKDVAPKRKKQFKALQRAAVKLGHSLDASLSDYKKAIHEECKESERELISRTYSTFCDVWKDASAAGAIKTTPPKRKNHTTYLLESHH